MTTYFVMTSSSGSAFTIGQVVGSGSPRIFNGDAIYVYRLSNAIWTTRDFGTNWINIIPSDVGWASTLCQTSGSATTNVTFVTGVGATTVPSRYQNYPENTAWSSGSAIASGDMSDSVSSTFGDLPILIGNIKAANAARVWRTDFNAPYGTVASDTGLPTTAQITDLDVSE